MAEADRSNPRSKSRSGTRSPGRALVLCDGSLPSLIAAAIELGGQDKPMLWSLPQVGDEAERVLGAIESLAQAFALDRVEGIEPASPATEHDRQDRLLVAAAHAALALNLDRVIWPIQPGGATSDAWPDLDAVGSAVDRAMLVARLVGLTASDRGMLEFAIETPLVDLSDEQVADLAVDLAVPVELCWWWSAPSASANAESDRWLTALERVGWRAATGSKRSAPA